MTIATQGYGEKNKDPRTVRLQTGDRWLRFSQSGTDRCF